MNSLKIGMQLKMTALNYNQLAKKKSLEEKIADLNQARQNLLNDLMNEGVTLDLPMVLPTETPDEKFLMAELAKIDSQQNQNVEWLRQQELKDFLNQAREGSRFVALERRWQKKPQALAEIEVASLQEEQKRYHGQVLESFDYLVKYFAQFEANNQVAMPEAAMRFFDQLSASFAGELQEILQEGVALQRTIEQEEKKLVKTAHQIQRKLRLLQEQIGVELSQDGEELRAILAENVDYQNLMQEMEIEKILRTAQLNEINLLINRGISFLEEKKEIVLSIVSQNKVTREALGSLKRNEEELTLEQVLKKIERAVGAFDKQVTAVLTTEVQKRFDEGKLDTVKREILGEIIDEVADFQDYLGQIFMESAQVIESNLEDIEQKRADYGLFVLNFFAA